MSIRKDKKSGVYFVDFRAPSGERVRGSARTSDRKEAEEYHDRLKAQYWRQAMLGEQPEHTFEEGAVKFLRAHEGEKDYATKVRHIQYWNDRFAGRALRSLTADEIEDALPTESAHLHKRGTVSGATKNRYLATIKTMLNECMDLKWIDHVPKLTKYYEPKRRVRWEPSEIIVRFLQELRLAWMRDAAIVAVATGMREAELFGLTVAQVNLAQHSAHVLDTKSGRPRAVPLNDDALEVLRWRVKGKSANELVFTRGVGLTARIHQKRDFSRACRLLGIKDFRWHDLRHTWASWHVQRGTPLLVLKELGGWETIEMVQKYAHLAPSHVAAHANTVKFWPSSERKEKTPLEEAA
ncbi:tyrosine-type recombinase/integrase [Burkholderia pseudomallei]|uniref:tyrosine-type recombinase/integrase n=1 Tax=Burkholderia pseudomallei TaxID=28450 RepID=UPI00057264D5|nr:site-specific integrase [Burkholderia pseudomallei]MBM5643591.1 tyrosine-type recombinase/integrase [Burkholderia pseudomallei]OMZ33866.1 integrase [Burkholderia pseudomallei]